MPHFISQDEVALTEVPPHQRRRTQVHTERYLVRVSTGNRALTLCHSGWTDRMFHHAVGEFSLPMMQVLNKVRKDGSFGYSNSLEGVEDEGS